MRAREAVRWQLHLGKRPLQREETSPRLISNNVHAPESADFGSAHLVLKYPLQPKLLSLYLGGFT